MVVVVVVDIGSVVVVVDEVHPISSQYAMVPMVMDMATW